MTTRILIEEKPGVLMVERGPFLDADGGRVAYVVVDGMATRRAVQVGAGSLSAIEIVSGLKEGERIVISSTTEFEGAEKVMLR